MVAHRPQSPLHKAEVEGLMQPSHRRKLHKPWTPGSLLANPSFCSGLDVSNKFYWVKFTALWKCVCCSIDLPFLIQGVWRRGKLPKIEFSTYTEDSNKWLLHKKSRNRQGQH